MDDVAPKKARASTPPCPWSQDGTSALLAHLQRLTDAIEKLERAQMTPAQFAEAVYNLPAPRITISSQPTAPLEARTTDPRPEPNQWAPRP